MKTTTFPYHRFRYIYDVFGTVCFWLLLYNNIILSATIFEHLSKPGPGVECSARLWQPNFMKTNAMRILDSLGIEYEVLEYPISDETNEDIALYTSRMLGIPSEQVYKTIIMENSDKEHFVFCLPAGFSISLKRARELTGSSSIDLMKTDKLLALTGYIRGGVSPIGMKRRFVTFVEELALLEDYVYISGGVRGLSLRLRPADLLQACSATFASFVQ